jgi:viroplasmin and RNaseH domain-containing protein
MSRKSEYTLDFIIQADESKDVLRDLQRDIKGVAEASKKNDLFEGIDKAELAATKLIDNLKGIAKDTSKDFDQAIAVYSKNSKKAMNELENQYARLRSQKEAGDVLAAKKTALENNALHESGSAYLTLANEIEAIDKELLKLRHKDVESAIQKNRHIRASLKSVEKEVKIESINAKMAKNGSVKFFV